VPCHRINKLGTHVHHRDRNTAEAIFANGTYFLDNPCNTLFIYFFNFDIFYISNPVVHLQEDRCLCSYEPVGSKRVENIEIKKLSINVESVHFISICCINILQCTVQKIIKFNFTVQLIKYQMNTTNHSLPPQKIQMEF